MCIRDCVLPCGGGRSGNDPVVVQKGTLVDFRSSVLHRNKEFWGEDAELFRPERWFEGNIRPKWEYVPFGGGARICPAQQMILTHYAYILARFVLEFEILENRDSCFEFVAEFNLSKRSRNGVQVELRRDSVDCI
jgi:cytochrome P450 monooxygenase